MRKPVVVSVLCFFSVVALALLFAVPASYGQAKVAAYTGADACKECHQDQYASYMKSIHSKKAIPGSPAAGQACEACHGPGGAHVEKGGGKESIVVFDKKTDPRKRSALCLNCHENSKDLISWSTGKHKTTGVSCDQCHTVHSAARHAIKTSETQLCLPCHRDVRNQVKRQSHHPMEEGKVKCTDCHTPHGGFGDKMIRADSTPDLCYKCHTEKRGPFAFEHPPVAENCNTCHQAHGSNHNNLLTSKPPQLCQACHNTGLGHTSLAYTAQHGFGGGATANKNRFFAQGCVNCHGNIHGSNRSPLFLR